MFDRAVTEVLETRRYDRLMERAVDVPRLIVEMVEDLLARLLDRLAISTGYGEGYNLNAIIMVFAVIMGVMIVAAGLAFFLAFLRRRRRVKYDLSDIFDELQQKRYSVADLLNLSASHENSSRRLAVRYRYIAALLSLHEQGVICIQPSSTSLLILKELEMASPRLQKMFAVAVECFHHAWFGEKIVADDAYEGFVAAVGGIIA